MPMVNRFVINSDLLKGAEEWERSDLESALKSCREFASRLEWLATSQASSIRRRLSCNGCEPTL